MRQFICLMGIFFCITFLSCRKESVESQDLPAVNTDLASDAFGIRPNQCRLTFWGKPGEYGSLFQYNDRGLVSEWKIDYYDGQPDVLTFQYDNFNRLKTGHVIYNYNATSFDFKYQYQGNRLIKETWYEGGTNTIADEIVNTYNSRGQIIRRASLVTNTYATFTYNFFGNNPLVYVYADEILITKEEFTYHQFNRNPLMAMNGIPVVLTIYDFVISNWWETSEKITVYEDGVPDVITDLDPSTTTMTFGSQLFPRLVSSFDRISMENSTTIFDYENCGGANTKTGSLPNLPSAHRNSRAAIIARFKRSLFSGPSRDIRKEISMLRKQLKK